MHVTQVETHTFLVPKEINMNPFYGSFHIQKVKYGVHKKPNSAIVQCCHLSINICLNKYENAIARIYTKSI